MTPQQATQAPSESALLQRAKQLDMQAIAEMYDRYSPGLFRYAYRLLGESTLAEDCVAETFSRLLGALQKGNGPQDHLQAYLYRIAHNWAADQYRRQPLQEIELNPELHDDGEDVLSTAAVAIETQQVRAALSQLTHEQRQVVMLKFVEGWDNAEIAVALEKPVGAVKALQHRAIAALKKLVYRE
jgi:RNA polymerase sigma-70 factor, ECF subfamily